MDKLAGDPELELTAQDFPFVTLAPEAKEKRHFHHATLRAAGEPPAIKYPKTPHAGSGTRPFYPRNQICPFSKT
jgi:hypothetical protein